MKRILAAVLLFVAAVSLADSPTGTQIEANRTSAKSITFTVANSLATNVAALTLTSGVALERGGAVSVVLSAEATRTISGGNLRCYVLQPVFEPNPDAGVQPAYRWVPYAALDFAPQTGNRDAASGDKQAFTGVGRIIWLPDSITVSAGTTVVATHIVRRGMPL